MGYVADGWCGRFGPVWYGMVWYGMDNMVRDKTGAVRVDT
jgi:hypothetical protein